MLGLQLRKQTGKCRNFHWSSLIAKGGNPSTLQKFLQFNINIGEKSYALTINIPYHVLSPTSIKKLNARWSMMDDEDPLVEENSVYDPIHLSWKSLDSRCCLKGWISNTNSLEQDFPVALVCSMERENIKHNFSTVHFLANYAVTYLNASMVFSTGLFCWMAAIFGDP